MTEDQQLGRYGGFAFAAGGVCTLIGSALHPTGGSSDYHASIATQLADPIGTPAAWLTLVGSLLIGCGLWVLLGSRWRARPPVVQLGARLAILVPWRRNLPRNSEKSLIDPWGKGCGSRPIAGEFRGPGGDRAGRGGRGPDRVRDRPDGLTGR